MNRWFQQRFLLLVASECLVLATITFALVTNRISGRSFGILDLLNMAVFFVVFLLFFRRAGEKVKADDALLSPKDAIEEQSHRLHRGIKASKRLIIMFVFFLIFGELVNWNSSPWTRIFGAAFDLALIAAFYRSMRRAKAKLELLGETN